MRVSAQTADSEQYDSAEAYDYIADKIKSGARTLSYEAEQKLVQKRYEETFDTEATVYLIANELTQDEINAELQAAGYNEREAISLATDFDASNEDSSVESGTGSQTSEEREKPGSEGAGLDQPDNQPTETIQLRTNVTRFRVES